MLQLRAGDLLVVALEPMNLVKLQENKPIEVDLTNALISPPGEPLPKKVMLMFTENKAAFIEALKHAGLVTEDTK